MQELARRFGQEKSSTSGLIARAERRALVTRTPHPDDGRVVHLALTAGAAVLAARIEAEVAVRVHALAAGLGAADRRRLIALSSALADG